MRICWTRALSRPAEAALGAAQLPTRFTVCISETLVMNSNRLLKKKINTVRFRVLESGSLYGPILC